MENKRNKKTQKKKIMTLMKKYLCLTVVLVLGLPLSGFQMGEQVNRDQLIEYDFCFEGIDFGTMVQIDGTVRERKVDLEPILTEHGTYCAALIL